MNPASTEARPSAMHSLRKLALPWACLVALFISTGCAVLPKPALIDRASAPAATIACADWYAALDRQTELAGVRDAGAARIAGVPYVRADRFTASLQDALPADAWQTPADAPTGAPAPTNGIHSARPHIAALVSRLQALDLQARQFELANLPSKALAQLASSVARASTPAALWQHTQDCARQLAAYTLAAPERTASLLQRIQVPDDYVASYRLLGVYAFTRLPFASGIRQFEAQRSAVFASAGAALPDSGAPTEVGRAPSNATTRLLLSPPAQQLASVLSAAQLRHILAPPVQDPLRVPTPTAGQAQQLLAHFAPSFSLAIDTDDDKPGALGWQPGPGPAADDTLEVDTHTPVVYSHITHTRYGPHSLLQLVYTLWFPARPKEPGKALDMLAGKLDGITWRVTLAPDGTPLVYDTMHPCGCYHMFFPTPSAQAKPAPQPGIEWAFIPQTLPQLTAQQHLVVHVAAGTHYIDRISVAPVRATSATPSQPTPQPASSSAAGGSVNAALTTDPTTDTATARYTWRSYDSLRSLPTSAAASAGATAASKPTHRSIFGPDGFIAHTDRAERFIFWPMGIPRAGAMRQWGKHATAFVGRRHFDDATLMEQRFEFDPQHFLP